MSLFRWLFPPKNAKAPPSTSGLSRPDANRAGHAQPPTRKEERMARRELLYSVVRQAMTRAGVLSSGYKFKVLSLDPKGHQFLVMVDLAHTFGREPSRLADIEAMVAQAAKARHDIIVNGVYWRMHEHLTVGDPAASGAQGRGADHSQPAALDAHPAQLDSHPGGLGARAAPRFEPIQADEVAAFKNALAAGASAPVAPAAPGRNAAVAGERALEATAKHHGPQNYMLLTGFEDTELPEGRAAPVLSGTQYGELN